MHHTFHRRGRIHEGNKQRSDQAAADGGGRGPGRHGGARPRRPEQQLGLSSRAWTAIRATTSSSACGGDDPPAASSSRAGQPQPRRSRDTATARQPSPATSQSIGQEATEWVTWARLRRGMDLSLRVPDNRRYFRRLVVGQPSQMRVRFSVQRRSLPKPFIHAWLRSTTHLLPAWIGAGTPLRAISPVKPNSPRAPCSSASLRVGASSGESWRLAPGPGRAR